MSDEALGFIAKCTHQQTIRYITNPDLATSFAFFVKFQHEKLNISVDIGRLLLDHHSLT